MVLSTYSSPQMDSDSEFLDQPADIQVSRISEDEFDISESDSSNDLSSDDSESDGSHSGDSEDYDDSELPEISFDASRSSRAKRGRSATIELTDSINDHSLSSSYTPSLLSQNYQPISTPLGIDRAPDHEETEATKASKLLSKSNSLIVKGILKKPNSIKNKEVRSRVASRELDAKKKLQVARRKHRTKLRKTLGEDLVPHLIPHTQDNRREDDETFVDPLDHEVRLDTMQDEFSEYFQSTQEPKILMTTCLKPSRHGYKCVNDFSQLIPNSTIYKRARWPIRSMCNYAVQNDFTSVLVFNEHKHKPSGLLVINLPDGPTSYFKMSNFIPNKKIKRHGAFSDEKPEIIVRNFTTRLGQTVGRLLASLFPQNPQFYGRRAVSFINHRDYIFLRHHRYIFRNLTLPSPSESDSDDADSDRDSKSSLPKPKPSVVLQEIGPQCTLKLRWIQKGLLDPLHGEYIFKHRSKLDKDRRKFYL